ncbi:MAG: uroporphyrinogen-III C-methyltransferase [Desulfovibrionaceae bacterium]|nr:uroporphyrinogen-III C-methyltransferase [Desulfovibrionaceae bacterium]
MADVYLIGAGPGDPGLLTIRARDILGLADVVVYDYLANRCLLSYARDEAEIVYVGKKGGQHTVPQEEINALVIDRARQGKTVARLKGGDPFVFGRGGEEAEEIVAAGLSYEVVPGVTAGVAAAAYAGIPVTHRAHTPSVAFITGHEDPAKQESAHDWEAYARSKSTLVFYMGVANLAMIADRLMAAGRPPDEPCALVRWGTTCRQRSFVSRLRDVAAEARARGYKAPSIIIVGGVCALKGSLDWFEKRPLLGKGVVVTRAREQASGLVEEFRSRGACVYEFPTIAVADLDSGPVEQAVLGLAEYDWLVFTSVNGVRRFWEVLWEVGLDARILAGLEIAAIGPATAEALIDRGLRPDFVPDKYVAEHVVQGLLDKGVANKKVLIPRALKAREVLPRELERAGARVTVLPVYETVLSGPDPAEVLEGLESGEIVYVTFTSSSTVENFFARIAPETMGRFGQARFACIGPVTAETLAGFGFKAHIQPAEYTVPALAEAVVRDATA